MPISVLNDAISFEAFSYRIQWLAQPRQNKKTRSIKMITIDKRTRAPYSS